MAVSIEMPSEADSAGADPAAEPVENRVFVLVLQHPHERKEPRATAAAAVGALRRARLVVGLSWPNLARALGRPTDPARWGVLYLGSLQPAALKPGQAALVIGRDGEPIGDPAPVLARIEGLVILDGTWSEAKTLWWRNPWLLKLHRLALNPTRPARLGQIRREPRPEALSTLEAIALALRHLEATQAASDALLSVLDTLIAGQRRPARPPHIKSGRLT